MKKVFSLKGKKCFNEVYSKGIFFKSRNCKLIKLDENDCERSHDCFKKRKKQVNFQIAVVIGKRYGKAYERNRAKRRIRAVLREYCKEFTGNFCMSLNVYSGIRNLDYFELKNEIRSLLLRSGILQNDKKVIK